MRKVKCSKANIALSPIIMYNKTVCKQPKAGEGFMQKIKDFCNSNSNFNIETDKKILNDILNIYLTI